IYEYPGINEVIVIGVKDEKWGEVGKAVISLKKGMNIEISDLQNYLGKSLAKYKIPKYYKIIEDIPKNNVGKVMRNEVERLYGSNDNN
ncbi:MAG: hypothetical protein NUK57_04190, partial [Gudongella sp.]|nr:hypothetical protein [Gudongella sp.]